MKEWEISKVQYEAYPCNVQFVILGSETSKIFRQIDYPGQWFYAQTRFLPAMYKTQQMYPNASFYIFGDDDTYFFKSALVDFLKTKDPNQVIGYGKSYCSWDFVQFLQPAPISCHKFLQGGAGVVLTNRLLSTVAPHLINCSNKFNSARFAGSMRFGICAARFLPKNDWELTVARGLDELFYSKTPETEVSQFGLSVSPITFHKLSVKDFEYIRTARYVDFQIKKQHYEADLGDIAFTAQELVLTIPQYRLGYVPGMKIICPFTHEEFNVSSKWKPIIKKKKLVGAQQIYGPFTVKLMFKNDISPKEVIPKNYDPKTHEFTCEARTPDIVALRKDQGISIYSIIINIIVLYFLYYLRYKV
ncbi:hypothetical protein TVAG_081780 [Trichomonas vaginalis G3]|uniref:N-acetylgalactosaminide beta-1,3-galactosyltransferase n=1 Tax=Trichomonas vaginalis (strain ATCC PRA-98 / G3) TaxID=412133 RepID=A2E6X0_TRIV3|nr:glycosyltransferase family 31 protein family [Trichomonas vaginalis G3]EAY11606.1 hypothetical protein TVAG_081780 [Trichomonas vaginalis G3]KAI5516511.1 glycosyltransferase family 31 protein family [Trichomonas vaginalis G3]|eukprot:XP_001323829.1 hypothetical protein [Trichomonas vaginalis G3]